MRINSLRSDRRQLALLTLTPSNTDLASHCRLLLHDRPRYTLLWRWGVLYPLYALSEIAIISTDLAELLGSAMALVMLFPKLEIWAGVLITTADVLLLLAMRNPIGGEPVRAFELGIAALVSRPPPPELLSSFPVTHFPSRND